MMAAAPIKAAKIGFIPDPPSLSQSMTAGALFG
jgi:hypothetical protein